MDSLEEALVVYFFLIWFEEGYIESEISERKQNRPPFEVLGP